MGRPTTSGSLERRVPDVAAPNVSLLRGEDRLLPAVAIARPRVATRAGDPWAERAAAVAPDDRALCLERFRSNAEGCLEALAVPLDRRVAYSSVEHDGQDWLTFSRGTCCLSYRRAGTKTSTDCVLVDGVDRDPRMRGLVAQRLEAKAV